MAIYSVWERETRTLIFVVIGKLRGSVTPSNRHSTVEAEIMTLQHLRRRGGEIGHEGKRKGIDWKDMSLLVKWRGDDIVGISVLESDSRILILSLAKGI